MYIRWKIGILVRKQYLLEQLCFFADECVTGSSIEVGTGGDLTADSGGILIEVDAGPGKLLVGLVAG